MTDTNSDSTATPNPVNQLPVEPQAQSQDEVKPIVEQPVDPQSTGNSPIPPSTKPTSASEQSASRLEENPNQGKVLTAQEVHGKQGTIILALVALLVLAGAATVFYLSSLGAVKPETYVMEGNKKTVKVKPSPSSTTSVSDDSVMGIKDDLNKITADDFTSDFSQIEKEAQSL